MYTVNKLILILFLMASSSLFSMVRMYKHDYATTDDTVTLEAADSDETFRIDKTLAESFTAVKNCLEEAHKESTLPIGLSAKELTSFLTIYRAGRPDSEILVNYTFDELLEVLTAVEYLGADEVRSEAIRNLSLSITRTGPIGESHNPSFYENPFLVVNASLLCFLLISYLDTSGNWEMSKVMFLAVFGNAFCAYFELLGKKHRRLEKRQRIVEHDLTNTVGQEFISESIYFEKGHLEKIGKAQFHDAIKCDIIQPCIESNKRLCRWIKGLSAGLSSAEVRDKYDHDVLYAFYNRKAKKKITQLQNDCGNIYKLLQETLGDRCLRVLANRLP